MRLPQHVRSLLAFAIFGFVSCSLCLQTSAAATETQLEDIPGYEQYRHVQRNLSRLATGGTVSRVKWSANGQYVSYNHGGMQHVVDLNTTKVHTGDDIPDGITWDQGGTSSNGRRRPPRGRQRTEEQSPDGKWTAICRDWNVVLKHNESDRQSFITSDGDSKFRFGIASWVYGEELDQNDAMWWSPDSSMLAFYEFDERNVKDYLLLGGWTDTNTRLMTEGYPKAGAPNPIVGLKLYHVESGDMVTIDAIDDPESYCYNIRFSPDGSQLLFNRTNRFQNILEIMAADTTTGATRVVVREEQDTWQNNRPAMRWLDDEQRFIWETEKTGWKQYDLRNLAGDKLAQLTTGEFPASRIVRVDESRGEFFYTAFSDQSNALDAHLHVASLDGSGQKQLTSETANHTSLQIAPDGEWFIATHESVTQAPQTHLYHRDRGSVLMLAQSDTSRFENMNLAAPELFTCKAADGTSTLYGTLYKPSTFDPEKSYPLIVFVYGGPHSQLVRNRWRGANANAELGFLIATVDNRGTVNRGKAFESANYLQLGTVDMADQAAAVEYLAERDYVDGERVGITGSSYGGYLAAMAVCRYPDVFHVAVPTAAVTDWRNYDTIYTERYMRTPQVNKEGYDAGSCMTYAEDFSGKMLLVHGMVDDNVHPSNAFQLINALQRADKDFEMVFYPNAAHGVGRHTNERTWEFFYEHLIRNPVNN